MVTGKKAQGSAADQVEDVHGVRVFCCFFDISFSM
jgi:ppGpp synthetase/RelA/SpoT-type nucleotidyltranferase